MTDTTQAKPDEFAWYKAALAAGRTAKARAHKPELAMTTDNSFIPSGFFRWKRKNGDRMAVAIWRDTKTSELRCMINGRDIKLADRQNMEWLQGRIPFIADEVIEQGRYGEFIRGNCTKWHDEDELAAADRAATRDDKAPTVFQHALDTYQGVIERWEAYRKKADTLIAAGAAADQSAADIATDIKNTLLAIEKSAEDQHKAEKAPHLKAGRDVDNKWNPTKNAAEALKKKVFDIVINPFLLREQRRVAAEHEAAVAAANAAAAAAAEQAIPGDNTPIPPAASPPPPPRVTAGSGGATGRKVSPREVWHAIILDREAFLLANKDHIKITEALQSIADQALLRDKANPPAGVEFKQQGLD